MEEERDWTQLVGNIWRLPEDGRLALRFQKRCLIQPFQNGPHIPSDPLIATSYLHQLAFDELQVPKRGGWRLRSELSRSNISITDYFGGGLPPIHYDINTIGYSGPTNEGLQARGAKSRGSRMCTFGPWRRIILIILNKPLKTISNAADACESIVG
ncbi:hypothetical protein B0O99DRAFT_365075 [Bisporella sp. PMI_857]|nr:hypothetical protein B0O99DRAFT_365075 [Bisporella sp. PMI_857]